MLELSPEQVALLERLESRGFTIVAFPLYESAAGVRKGDCAALLTPVAHDGFRLVGEPTYLVTGKLSVRVHRGGRQWFVWKKEQLEATAERLAELAQFRQDLEDALAPQT
jgi:hypothetical protein